MKQTSLPTSNWGDPAGLQVVDERDNGIVGVGIQGACDGRRSGR